MVSVFSRAGLPTELLRADFISEKVAGLDVSRTLQPRFGASAAAASADVTALLNDSDFDESKEQAEDPSGISPADLSDWAPDDEETEAMDDLPDEMLSDDFPPPPPEAAAAGNAATLLPQIWPNGILPSLVGAAPSLRLSAPLPFSSL